MSFSIPSPAFHDAAAYLSSASSLSRVSNDVKLELYGLFKYLTVSPNPNTTRPSLFDFTGRAKWDAWARVGKAYPDDALSVQERYLVLAKDLGWEEGASTPPQKCPEVSVKDINDIWDDDDDEEAGSSRNHGGETAGLGPSVSTVSAPPTNDGDTSTLHGLAVTCTVDEITSFFAMHPDVDVNARDEFGYAALHLAADRGNVAAAAALLSKGADRTLQDPDEFTAEELAKIAGHETIVKLLARP